MWSETGNWIPVMFLHVVIKVAREGERENVIGEKG